jgi:hypothetical protein
MIAVPVRTPVTTPDTTDATVISLLVHVPPGMLLVKVTNEPAQTLSAPEIDPGIGTTVIMVVT